MKKIIMLAFMILFVQIMVSCDSDLYDESEIYTYEFQSSAQSSDLESSESSQVCKEWDPMTAVEFCELTSKESGFMDVEQYEGCKFIISGYLNSVNADKDFLDIWYSDTLGDFSFYFEDMPEIDLLSNYVTVEGICKDGFTPSFENCKLISQETKSTEVVYWEKERDRIHFGNQCFAMSLAQPDKICSGSWDDAINSGCTEVCLDCIHLDISEAEYIEQLVYWVPNGTRIHIKENCPTIIHSDQVIEGNISDAHNAGLFEYCQRCS